MSNSEVARLRQELEASAQAAWMGLYGLAEGVAKHQTITKRMENLTQSFDALASVVGEEQAMQVWIAVSDQQDERQDGKQSQDGKRHDTLSCPQSTEQQEEKH